MMAPMLAVGSRSCTARSAMPFPALNSAFDGLYGPGDQWYWRADFVDEIPDEAIARNAEWNSNMPTLEVRVAHLPDRRRRARRRARTRRRGPTATRAGRR